MAGKKREKQEHPFLTMFYNTILETFKNITRNNLMSFASIISIITTLLILGSFIAITLNVDNISNAIVSSLEIKVFLEKGVTSVDVNEIEDFLDENRYVTSYSFESGTEALEKYSEQLEDYAGLLDGYTEANNPVSDSLTVSVSSPEYLETVKEEIEDLRSPAVDYVKFAEEYLDTVVYFDLFSRIVSLGILLILSVISVFIVYNTIKLAFYSNRKEIEIMQFLGAENWYIKLPYFFEGIILGVVGAFFASFILLLVYLYMLGLSENLAYMPLDTALLPPRIVFSFIILFNLIYGILIGSLGSLFSIRKYFKT